MILFILGGIFLICGIIFIHKAKQIKISKQEQQQQYQTILKTKIEQLEKNKILLLNQQIQKRKKINQQLIQWQDQRKEQIKSYIDNQKKLANQNVEKTRQLSQNAITQINNQLQNFKITAGLEKTQIQKQINKLKSSLSAGVQARLREQQKKDKLNFYKLSLNNADFEDVKKLQDLKLSFHNPTILSKLIWTQYFQKQMTELCDRVFGKKVVCGIYKITDLLTQQCYIGQSVNIQQRMKQHCKCGLGIQASATNKLYNTMQKDKVWNFTFELLEQCPRQLLNEKEKFWIEMYQSNKFGLNTTKGNN